MHTTTLGELTVSAQGLGCMGMSEFYGHTDWDESVATIHRAHDLGVTFLDTADIYGAGHNEVLVGRAIAHRREEVQLATKFGIDRPTGDGGRVRRGEPAYVKRCCDASLLRLGVDVNVAAMDVTLTGDELTALEPLAGQVAGGRY